MISSSFCLGKDWEENFENDYLFLGKDLYLRISISALSSRRNFSNGKIFFILCIMLRFITQQNRKVLQQVSHRKLCFTYKNLLRKEVDKAVGKVKFR